MASTELEQSAFLSKAELESFPTSPDEIRKYLESIGLDAEQTVYRSSEYDLAAKEALVGVPIFIIQWEEKPSEQYGGMYVVVHGIETENGHKFVFADGGSGVAAQLMGVTTSREEEGLPELSWRHGLTVPGGLVRSDYESHASKVTGEVVPAGTTFYLS